MKPPRVLLFDVFGTLVDWRSSLIGIAQALAGPPAARADSPGPADSSGPAAPAGWAAIIDDWRRAYQPAMDQIRDGGTWRDLDSLQRETLTDVLARHDVRLSAAGQETLVRGWRQLRPWPDSREGLDRLRRTYVTATLSNGHIALLVDLLKFADLRVDAVLSAQLADAYKPDPKVYAAALRLLGCLPEDAAMVAAHPADLRAAAALGLRPVFIRRPLEWGPGAPAQDPPALDGLLDPGGLVDLAEALGC